jgi:transcriptional regulator with XRE-family HTH domain
LSKKPKRGAAGTGEPSLFGRHLRRFRLAAGWSQERLGGEAGVHPVTISRIESGHMAEPGWDNAHKLAAALGRSLDEFVAPFSDDPDVS